VVLDLLAVLSTATLLGKYYIKVNTGTSRAARLDGKNHALHKSKIKEHRGRGWSSFEAVLKTATNLLCRISSYLLRWLQSQHYERGYICYEISTNSGRLQFGEILYTIFGFLRVCKPIEDGVMNRQILWMFYQKERW